MEVIVPKHKVPQGVRARGGLCSNCKGGIMAYVGSHAGNNAIDAAHEFMCPKCHKRTILVRPRVAKPYRNLIDDEGEFRLP